MAEVVHSRLLRFATFEIDSQTGELRRSGLKLKLTGQPFQVLAILLERPGEVVTREELRKRLWPDTFVDVDHNLNTAINKIREVLGDSAESPRFVETLPRRGYRFIAPVEAGGDRNAVNGGHAPLAAPRAADSAEKLRIGSKVALYALLAAMALLVVGVLLFYRKPRSSGPPKQRTLTRVTFDDGLQLGAAWSPDGRFIAYSSDRGGKFDIWVQQISGGDPIQVTRGSDHNWQPNWSPDGKYLAYRSEEGGGGLFVIPALGGAGLQRRIAAFGYYPRWSPDGSKILFQTTQYLGMNRFYIVGLDGTPPHEVLAEFLAQHKPSTFSAAWYPDGKRISAWVWEPTYGPNFWTVPLAGGIAVRSEISPELAEQVKEIAGGVVEWSSDFTFSWAPSGRAIYFARTFRGARNLWKMTIDPKTLSSTSIERVTTGPGADGELALSLDGNKLAFTGETQRIRAWLFPFDGSRGILTGSGLPVTLPGMQTWRQSLSRDGSKLAFSCNRGGRSELWEMSLLDSHMNRVVADDLVRDFPVWSPDGKRLVYERTNLQTREDQLVLWSAEDRSEKLLSDARETSGVYDWSPDGKSILISQHIKNTNRSEIQLLPIAAAPLAESAGRRIISDPAYDLQQAHFSRDGRWVVFQAVRDLPTTLESTLYVTPASGGPWIRITEGKHWDDKPRWSPDGRMIYFLSGRSGFFNVWGIHFDPALKKPIGAPFAVTRFESPALMVPQHVPSVELSLNQDHLVLTVEQVSGSIWVLENVDQ